MRTLRGHWLVPLIMGLTVATARGQSLYKSIAGGGYTHANDGRLVTTGTFGQPVIGITTHARDRAALGFWDGALNLAVTNGLGTPHHLADVRLLSAAPNPFRRSTTLHFSVAKPENVQLEVFDDNGRRVHAEHFPALPAGQHDYLFSTGSLPPGAYRFVMRSPSARNVGTMTIIK